MSNVKLYYWRYKFSCAEEACVAAASLGEAQEARLDGEVVMGRPYQVVTVMDEHTCQHCAEWGGRVLVGPGQILDYHSSCTNPDGCRCSLRAVGAPAMPDRAIERAQSLNDRWFDRLVGSPSRTLRTLNVLLWIATLMAFVLGIGDVTPALAAIIVYAIRVHRGDA